MLKKAVVLGVIAGSLSMAGWLVATTPWASGDESVASKVEDAMAEEAAKERFVGRIGDFDVGLRSNPDPAALSLFTCKDGAPTDKVDDAEGLVRSSELWADVFDTREGTAWACRDEGVILFNNQGMSGSTSTGEDVLLIRGYFDTVPVPILRDAPRDRFEQVEIDGRPGLLERPIEGYPYGTANLVVIERYPDGGAPGILVVVERAESADRALELAAEIVQ